MRTEFKDTRDMKLKQVYQSSKLKEGIPEEKIKIKSFGERLKSARKKVKWTQKKCAEFFALKNKQSINNYEKNLRRCPSSIISWIRDIEHLTTKEARKKYRPA